jgi:hypothetical protein
MPIVAVHGEWHAEFKSEQHLATARKLFAMRC